MFNIPIEAQEITKDSISVSFRNIYPIDNAFNKNILKICQKIDTQRNALDLFRHMDSIAPSTKSKLLFYNRYISYLLRINLKQEAIEKCQLAIELSKKYAFDRFEFEYNQLQSYSYIVTSKLDSALHYANEAEKLVTNNNTLLGKELYRVYLHKGEIEELLGNDLQRTLNFEKAAKSLEPYPNNKNNAYVLAYVANHFKSSNNYLKHAYYSQKLKAFYLTQGGFNNPDKHRSITSFLDFEDSDEQIEMLKKSLQIKKGSFLTVAQRLHLNELAAVLIETNKPNEAIAYLRRNIQDKDSIPITYKLMSHSLLERAYTLLNDCDETLNAVNAKTVLIDSLRKKEMIAKIADAKIKYATEKKEAELALLKLEKEKQKQKNRFFIIIISLGLGVILLTLFFLNKNAKKNTQLFNQNILLERTVDEKNLLLKEIHHRVKNSFQIVSSLLYLQSENIEDKEAKLAIKEAENRVRSMVLVHQKLYSKEELVGINTKEYFGDLVKDIFESHQFKTVPIAYELDVEPLVLDIETITPLGLILNELIINTLKHAFKEVNAKSKLAINLHHKNDELILKVVDNGIGFEGAIKNTSFGIKLMKALSKKLKASLNYNSLPNHGTEAILQIKKFNLLS